MSRRPPLDGSTWRLYSELGAAVEWSAADEVVPAVADDRRFGLGLAARVPLGALTTGDPV